MVSIFSVHQTNYQLTIQRGRRQAMEEMGRQPREWTALEFSKARRVVENLAAKSSVMVNGLMLILSYGVSVPVRQQY